jgi:hypothetical protein
MSMIFNIKDKWRFIGLLIVILIIELFSSLSQANNVSKLNSSINEIYSDRLIAQDFIYKISSNIYFQKEILYSSSSKNFTEYDFKIKLDEISSYISKYENTLLTPEESIVLNKLKKQIVSLKDLFNENQSQIIYSLDIKKLYLNKLDEVLFSLKELSEIQMKRSLELKTESLRTVEYSDIINEIFSVLIIISALCVFAILLTVKSTIPKSFQNSNLN